LSKVRFWIDAILEANRRDHTDAVVPGGDQRGPFRSARALAIAMMAMHDAHARITGIGTPYRPGNPAPIPPAADPEAAAAAAAMAALRGLYPKQEHLLHEHWGDYSGTYATPTASIAFGRAVALEILAWRAADEAAGGPLAPTTDYVAWQPYDHGPDPLSPGQGYAGANWGRATPFLVPRQPLAEPPGAAAAPAMPLPVGTPVAYAPDTYYDDEYKEVMERGALHSARRTPDQEEIGLFWAYDGAQQIGTPPRLYIQVALAAITCRPTSGSLSSSALLEVLSAAAVAMGDAGIQAWHYKYDPHHMLWRPVLGIRNADPARPTTPRDPTWTPLGKPETNTRNLGTTPDFPAYPSGHATFGAACFDVLRRWVRAREGLAFTDAQDDGIAFDFTSDELNGRNTDPRTGLPRRVATRRYPSLWRAIVDNSESRIWLGVHWRMDGISVKGAGGAPVHGSPATPGNLGPLGGVALGMRIAEAVATARGFA
jgi:vanadium chloroperoxidase